MGYKEKIEVRSVIITMLTIYGISLYVMIPLLSPVVYGGPSTKTDNSLEASVDTINEANLHGFQIKKKQLS